MLDALQSLDTGAELIYCLGAFRGARRGRDRAQGAEARGVGHDAAVISADCARSARRRTSTPGVRRTAASSAYRW